MASSSGEIVLGISGAMKPEKKEKFFGDRFSGLPDAVAHRILSFVNVQEFGSVMLVSKRFNHLCFSAPFLSMVNESSTEDSHRAKLDSFFSAYFSRRRQYGYKVGRLSISFHQATPQALESGMTEQKVYEEDDPVFACLRRCTSYCSPEHVELNLLLRDGVCLETNKISAYLLGLVRNVVLSMNNTGGFTFINYSFPFASRLESLTLQAVKLSYKSDYHFDNSDFPALKLLRLYDCTGMKSLQIWNNSLERLEIIIGKLSDLCSLTLGSSELRTLLLTWYPKSVIGRVFLYLPQMEHLEWKGYPLQHFGTRIFKHLKSATVYCRWLAGRNLDKDYHGSYLSFVVDSVSSAKSLHLNHKTIEILIMQLSKNIVPSSFEGVETLHIDECHLTDVEVPDIAFVLKMMPGLKNICVSSYRVPKPISYIPDAQLSTKSKKQVQTRIPLEETGFKVDYWEAQDLKFVQQLETATVEIHNEQGNAIELIKYFAKHGEHLETLKVICPLAMVSAVSGQIEVVKSNAVNVTYVQGVKL